MRYIFDLVPLRAFVLVMMAGATIWIGILRSNAYPNRGELKNFTIGSEQMHHAFAQSDLVVVGTVTQVRNYTATDGGHGYEIAVSDVLKGNRIEHCSVRAGGWAYTIRFTLKQKVLLFLKKSNINFTGLRGPGHDAKSDPESMKCQSFGGQFNTNS